MRIKEDIKIIASYTKWISKNIWQYKGTIALIAVMDIIGALAGVAVAVVSKNVIDYAIKGLMDISIFSSVLFGILILIMIGSRAVSTLVSVKTRERISNHIRKHLLSCISNAQWLSISQYHSGDIATRMTGDVSVIAEGFVHTIPEIITFSVQLAAAFGTLLYYEPYLAILAFILGPFTVLFSRFWGRKLKQLQVKVQEAESECRAFLQESLQNMLIVKTYCLSEQNMKRIDKLNSSKLQWVLKRSRTSIMISTILGLGYWIGYLSAFSFGGMRLSSGSMTFGTLTAFLQLVGQIQTPFVALSKSLPGLISTAASIGRIMELEGLPDEDNSGEIPAPAFAGVFYDNVTYSYGNKPPVLKEISLKIKPGDIVAITGSSGEGKTTMIRLILSLLNPVRGKVYLVGGDGYGYEASAKTRDWISYVPQGNSLFSGTIADNIRCGQEEAPLEDLIWAAKAAGAWSFIKELPEGLDTVIGEDGLGLSEGQAQRIAIARALLRKAPILILDEATSALDMNTEMHILNELKKMKPARTCIIITHRRSVLSICSRILKLQDGKLTVIGQECNPMDEMVS